MATIMTNGSSRRLEPSSPKDSPMPTAGNVFFSDTFDNSETFPYFKNKSEETATSTSVEMETMVVNANDSGDKNNNLHKDDHVSPEQCLEIMNSIINRTALPSHMKEVPSRLTMAKCTVVLTRSVSKRQREAMTSKITEMGGVFSSKVCRDTTHIITNKGLSDKVKAGREQKASIVTPDLITAAWNEGALDPYVHVTQPRFNEFTCLLFRNVNFCISEEIEGEARKNLVKLILKQGGQIKHNIFKNAYVDILICKNAKEECFKVAKTLSVPALKPSWVIVCWINQLLVDYVGFEVEKGAVADAQVQGLLNNLTANDIMGYENLLP